MLHQNDETRRVSYYYIDLSDVKSAERSIDEPMKLSTDDDVFYSACINCHQPRCLYYYEDEYTCNSFDNFAERQDDRVCAFDAITWDNDKQAITIEYDACIGCGICANRCPFGALYMDEGKMAINLDRSEKPFEVSYSIEYAPKYQEECIDRIRDLTVDYTEDQRALDRVKYVYQRLNEVRASHEAALLLCRNLMIEVGTQCALRRTGVSSTRMDAVYTSDSVSGAIEIEFQSDSLSVARNLLDDVAMMQTRIGLPMESNTPLAICAAIPNTRQGYYQVCDDIYNILGLRVRTLTIAALLILVWNGVELNLDNDRFRLGFRDTSIREDVEALLGYRLRGNDYAGFLEPIK
jgi:Fe-S-cluster-containing hydrogenase component 2